MLQLGIIADFLDYLDDKPTECVVYLRMRCAMMCYKCGMVNCDRVMVPALSRSTASLASMFFVGLSIVCVMCL